MSPKNPVLPLSYLCVKFVSAQLIQALADDEGVNYGAVAVYLSDATYEVLQDLLKTILNSVNLDAATRFSCLHLLLREDVTKLDTGIFPHSYYQNILHVIREQGIGLQQLNLKGVWVRDHPHLLCKVLKSLTKLRVLIIPHMADDSVVSYVARCEHLNTLDISGEACFMPEGVRLLTNRSLKVLDIGNFGKRDVCEDSDSGVELVAEIIQQLPNLNSLRTYSFTGGALLSLYNQNRQFKTKLKYLHDTGTTLETIEAITQLCPDLESIHVDSPAPGVLLRLGDLRKLNCLKLTRPDCEELTTYLREAGDRLQVLKLNHNKNQVFDLSEVCVSAPNVHTLECYLMKISFSDPDTYFMCLQNAELLYCDMTDSLFKYVLTNSPFLKRIITGCRIFLTDGDFFRICAECEFPCLEEVWISSARSLTVITVELLMGHCPMLRVIGQLNGWDVHLDELEYLRARIVATNTDLALLPLDYST